MKLSIPQRKDWTILSIVLFGVFILYWSGEEERTHPDEYSINFKTPLLQPDRITCGPTSIAMVLYHYGQFASINAVKKQSRTVWFTQNGQDVGMTIPNYIPTAMNYFDVPSTMRYGDIDVLKHYISQGKPCIVLVRSGELLWHYIVVYGFTIDKLQIADPGDGYLSEMNEDTFIGCWSWVSDMRGRTCGKEYICTLLKAMEVYPYTFICPDNLPD